jgi:cytochrome P450
MDEALTMLLAGSDTTAAAVSWSAYLLAKHPEIQRSLCDEVMRLTDGGPLSAEDALGLELAQQVFQEAMRLYPPAVAIARQAIESVEIGGIHIPSGALVFVLVYSMHHDPRWFPEPEEFRPQRFSPEHQAEIRENAYLPFGLGPRACIGRRFAMMEGPLVLAELVRRFELQLIDPSFEPQLETQLSLHPRGGLQLRVKHRSGLPRQRGRPGSASAALQLRRNG